MVGEGNHNLYGVLQNSMDVVEGETGNSSGTGVTCDDGTEEVCMKLEDAIDIKGEFSITVEDAIDIKEEFTIAFEDTLNIKNGIPEAITFTPVKSELEVRLWCVCVCVCVVAAHAFRPFIA